MKNLADLAVSLDMEQEAWERFRESLRVLRAFREDVPTYPVTRQGRTISVGLPRRFRVKVGA